MIRVEGVHKAFGRTVALDGVSFSVERGEVVGIIGPAGAGKSTTLRIITGYLACDRGRVQVAGHDLATARQQACRHIGYVPEAAPLHTEMRVEPYLRFRGRLKGVSRAQLRRRIDAVLEQTGLSEVRRRVIGKLDRGLGQRVGIADALIARPPILVFDEPTFGLDPTQLAELRALLAQLARDHTVILSSHVLPEIERAADRVVVLSGGRVVGDGRPDELRAELGLPAGGSLEDVFMLITEVEPAPEAEPDPDPDPEADSELRGDTS